VKRNSSSEKKDEDSP